MNHAAETEVPAFASSGTEAPLPPIPGLDLAAGLESVGGRLASYRRLLAMFRAHHADDVAQIRAQLAAGKLDEARRLAHALKGAAAALGAQAVRERALEVELAVRDGSGGEEMEAKLAALEAALGALIEALAAQT